MSEEQTHDESVNPADDMSQAPAPGAPASDPLAKLQSERDELYGRLQRVSADYQNYMRRAEANLGDSIAFARGDLLKLFLPVLDHFDTALSMAPKSDDGKALYEGVRIVRDELIKVLEQAGVERFEPTVGEPFDPHRHEAMLQQKAEGVAPNHIAATFSPGYVFRQRTLRPAKVAVVPQS
ncbi:MAG: nucleotide exchange factor GrpE [Planctomycetes bacterium]|nr:nucleotide exchange factor GrpE [Planctomycetota bacterium]